MLANRISILPPWKRFYNNLAMPKAGALHTSLGDVVLESCFRRRPIHRARWFYRPQPINPASDCIETLPPVIFLPYLQFEHFGHLLTETAAWLSPLLSKSSHQNQPSNLLLGCWPASATEKLVEILNYDENHIFCTSRLKGQTCVPEAWIPIPSMVNRDHVSRRHSRSVRRLLRRMYCLPRRDFTWQPDSGAKLTAGSKLYLSRSRLNPRLRKIERECELDLVLQELGWKVIHPELLSVPQQLSHLRSAKVVAGALGSAFHLLFPLGLLSDGPLILSLGFPDELTADGPGMNFGMQFQSQQLHCNHLPLLALQDSDLDPSQARRDAHLQFIVEPEQVALRLQSLADAFISGVPQ